jgi:NitT/TauT family transport system substrate-binding protein
VKFPRLIIGVLVCTLAAITGCSSDSGDTPKADLEKTQLTVGTMAVVDAAPLEIAVRRGLFKAEGLDVKLRTISGAAEALPLLKNGQLDVSMGAYIPFYNAVASGEADLKIVAEGSRSAPGTHTIMVPPDSDIQTPADLKGKKIGVNTKYSAASMLVRAAAKVHGVTLDEEKNFLQIPPPEMQNALMSGKVHAIQAIEPFATIISQATGARVIWDTSQGATAEFPIAGYAAMSEFVTKYPKTLAAFQRALAKGHDLANDRAIMVDTIPQFTTIKPDLARNVAVGLYSSPINPTRLQRVLDNMREFGLLQGGNLKMEQLLPGATASK